LLFLRQAEIAAIVGAMEFGERTTIGEDFAIAVEVGGVLFAGEGDVCPPPVIGGGSG
jgi:hypothetical protein